MSEFERLAGYKVGDIVSLKQVNLCEEKESTSNLCFNPDVFGYLGWLANTVDDFFALVINRVLTKGRRTEGVGSTEPHWVIERLMAGTQAESLTSLAEMLDVEPEELRKYMTPIIKAKGRPRWVSTYKLRSFVARVSINERARHGASPVLYKSSARNFKLLDSCQTGFLLLGLDKDEFYSRVAHRWRVRHGERARMPSPSFIDLPWLVDVGMDVAMAIWQDHTRFQQLCLEEAAIYRQRPSWFDCRLHMHES